MSLLSAAQSVEPAAGVSALLGPARLVTAAPESQQVTDWGARIAWVVGLLLFIALVYWLMRQGWRRRGLLQSDLPPLPTAPDDVGEPVLRMTGRYHGSTSANQWLDRIVAHGLGTRSRAELLLTERGLVVTRPGAQDFFVPVDRLRGARPEKGIAGKVLTEGGLLVVTWAHGERLLDSGFRSDHPGEHAAWLTALRDRVPADVAGHGPADANDGAGPPGAVTSTDPHPTPERVPSGNATDRVTRRAEGPATTQKDAT